MVSPASRFLSGRFTRRNLEDAAAKHGASDIEECAEGRYYLIEAFAPPGYRFADGDCCHSLIERAGPGDTPEDARKRLAERLAVGVEPCACLDCQEAKEWLAGLFRSA